MVSSTKIEERTENVNTFEDLVDDGKSTQRTIS
jgi:hypothetical protein